MNENNKSPVSAQFKKDMELIIAKWEKEQHDFYESMEEDIKNASLSETNSRVAGILSRVTYDNFPKFIRWGVFTNENATTTIPSDFLVSRVQQNGGTYSDKGTYFEKITDSYLKKSVLQKLGKVIELSLKHTGDSHLREDFELKDSFTFDAKFTENKNVNDIGRYRNIVKEWGGSLYAAIHQIEDNIVRSLYSEGALVGDIHAKQNKDKAIYSLERDKKTRELIDFVEHDNKARKILIYLYPENGYWASECLRHVTNWAFKRLEDTAWQNINTRKGEKVTDNYLHTFQGFWYNNK